MNREMEQMIRETVSPELDVDQQSVDDVETLGREDLDQISFTVFLNCLESNIPGTLGPASFSTVIPSP